MNQSALNAFLQELKNSIEKLESVLTRRESTEESSLWFPPADKKYGPWISHRGNIPPVPYGTKIQRLSRAERHDRRFNATPEESRWARWHDGIVAYRVRLNQWVPTPHKNYGPWIYFEAPNEVRDGLGKELIENLGSRRVRILTTTLLAAKRVSRARLPDYWEHTENIIAYSVENPPEKTWYPEDCEGFGPWIENNGVDYRKLASATLGQVLYDSERSTEEWDPAIVDFDDTDFEEGDEDYVVAYRLKQEEKPWYPPDYVFGPWIETHGKDFHLPPTTRIQVLTKNDRANKLHYAYICTYDYVNNPASTTSYKDIVAYRTVT